MVVEIILMIILVLESTLLGNVIGIAVTIDDDPLVPTVVCIVYGIFIILTMYALYVI